MAEAKKELERTQELGLNSSTDDLVSYMVDLFPVGRAAGSAKDYGAGRGTAGRVSRDPGPRRDAAIFRPVPHGGGDHAAGRRAGGARQGSGCASGLPFGRRDRAAGWLGCASRTRRWCNRRCRWTRAGRPRQLAALAAAVCGNGKLALPLALELSKKYPQDTLIQDVFAPLSKAFVALAAGRAQEAVDAAEPAKPYDANYPASYVQGLAYLQLHDAGHALTAFQAAIRANAGTLQIALCAVSRAGATGVGAGLRHGRRQGECEEGLRGIFR